MGASLIDVMRDATRLFYGMLPPQWPTLAINEHPTWWWEIAVARDQLDALPAAMLALASNVPANARFIALPMNKHQYEARREGVSLRMTVEPHLLRFDVAGVQLEAARAGQA